MCEDTYINDPGPKIPVTGLRAACSTDSGIVTETILKVTPVYDLHMGSFQMCWRDPETGELSATADPRRCGVASGLRN